MRRLAIGIAAACALSGVAVAQSEMPRAPYADRQLADPAREAEARALMHSLRCLVCQGQSIADSDADMAADMRALVRERVGRGESAEAVRGWLIDRYGEYVSYDPPLSRATVLLWATPLLLLLCGLALARQSIRRRR